MFALAARQRLACLSRRQLQRTARSYASDAHHQPSAEGNESFGKGSIATLTALFGSMLLYTVAPAEGEESAVTNFIAKYLSRPDDWADINALHTKVMEQAGFDRNLFENASSKHRFVDVSYPEAIQSYAPRNIPAGHIRNIDDVVEHYRQLHFKEEA